MSTGSSLAVSALPQAALRGISAHYIESVTRTDGVSVSGRIVSTIPRVKLYVQWPHLARRRWRYQGSVIDGFHSEANESAGVRRIVVSLGTSAKYGFRRLVERLVLLLPPGADILWQTGSTDASGLRIAARPTVPAHELSEAIRDADVVVAHAGAGIALTILSAGKVPVLVPRLATHGEHVDDHQEQIARRLERSGLAVVSSVDDLSIGHLELAAGQRVRRSPTERFRLDDS